MAFVTGQANDIDALRTAIVNACTANGWVLNGDVLSKGAVFIEVTVDTGRVHFLGGLGIDGGNQLTTPGLHDPRIADFVQPITYPVTYEIHILTAPDEVYVVINYNIDFWQWAAWGQSNVAGLPGAGVWYAASKATNSTSDPVGTPDGNQNTIAIPFLFGWTSPADTFGGGFANCFIHHGFDGGSWNPPNHDGVSGPVVIQPNAWRPAEPLQYIQPNVWNDEAILVPVQVWVARSTGNKVSLAADLAHARYTRNDFIDPGEIITLGPDSWKVYPWYRKNVANRDAPGEGQDTGTFAWAVRYTGP